ncbi:MAG: gamma-glutamyltransferase [Verrucomicrobiales bacterium]|nr:gamma-glutamyltransferase [Verrucomicrobiales bacterium]
MTSIRPYPQIPIALVVPCVLLIFSAGRAISGPFAPGSPVTGSTGMVATQEAHATRAAAKVLAEGGNAIDAAVCAGFTLAVTLPRAGNIGGGGFMLIHLEKTNRQTAIDYREKAPTAAHRDMFLDSKGNVDTNLSRSSRLAAGVPGTVRGLALALQQHGTISLKRAIQPAIELAEDGFIVGQDLHQSLKARPGHFKNSPAALQAYYNPDGSPPAIGSRLIQKDLARTLRTIADQGPDAFYAGPIAAAIVADMKANGGIITADDLRDYRPIIRQPISGTYRDWKVVAMPPPSSGGIHLIQMLNILEKFPIAKYGHNSANTMHICIESMRRAYADRSRYLGDPDFTEIPTKALISKGYAKMLSEKIDLSQATPSGKVSPGLEPVEDLESNETTHFSVIDRWGNAVTNTYTLNFSYGSGIMVAGTGILLNNEMDDFSAKPGVPNAYGLLGGKRNAIEPNKRMLSSMTPTLLFKGKNHLVATGSPGGSRIITTVLQIVCNLVDHGMNIAGATAAARFHHQWFPDEVQVEPGFDPDILASLRKRSHTVKARSLMGSTQTVARINGLFFGASDPRRQGALAIGINDGGKKTRP